MQLTSWVEKSPNWCSPDELIALQTRVQSMVDKNVKLVDVIQVMLVHRILPCQSRSRSLWEFNLKKHHTLKRLFETTHEDAWKLLFKGNEKPPVLDSNRGHDHTHPANEVSSLRHTFYLFVQGGYLTFAVFFVFSGVDGESEADP